MSHWFVSYSEFTEIMSDHLWFDIHANELFTVMYTDFCTNHFRENNEVSHVSFNSAVFAAFL